MEELFQPAPAGGRAGLPTGGMLPAPLPKLLAPGVGEYGGAADELVGLRPLLGVEPKPVVGVVPKPGDDDEPPKLLGLPLPKPVPGIEVFGLPE